MDVEKLMQVSLIYKNNPMDVKNREMCNIINNYVSVMFIQNNFNSSC